MLLTTAMCFAVAPAPSLAQSRGTLAAQADVLLRSASERSLDDLFQSVHGLSKSPQDSARLCRALASPERGSADTWLRLAQEIAPAHRDALSGALGDIALSGWRGQPAAFNEDDARKSLRQAGVRAALLNEGFSASTLSAVADTQDAQADALRCRSLGWLLDAVATQPRGERAAITRLLLRDGVASLLQQAAPDASPASGTAPVSGS